MRRLLLICLGLGFIASITALSKVVAAAQCGDLATLSKHLKDRFAEVPIAEATDSRGRKVKVFSSSSGSWTLLLVLKQGPACILSAGDKWRNLNADRSKPGRRSI